MKESQPGVQVGMLSADSHGPEAPGADMSGAHPAESVLTRWRKEYDARGEEAFGERRVLGTQALEARVAELERFCGQLALENEILKRASRAAMSRTDTH